MTSAPFVEMRGRAPGTSCPATRVRPSVGPSAGLCRPSTSLTLAKIKDVDGRSHSRAKRRRSLNGYGERSDAVLRTAMPGDGDGGGSAHGSQTYRSFIPLENAVTRTRRATGRDRVPQSRGDRFRSDEFLSGACVIEDLPEGEGWAMEWIWLSTHSGTDLDAPGHFSATMDGGKRAITIVEVPLEWCMQPGVKLDFRHFPTATSRPRRRRGRARPHRPPLRPWTSPRQHRRQRGFWTGGLRRDGLRPGREATLYLLERGVRVTGTDGWSWDAPFIYTKEKYARPTTPSLIWEGHRAGREIGYCHLEAA